MCVYFVCKTLANHFFSDFYISEFFIMGSEFYIYSLYIIYIYIIFFFYLDSTSIFFNFNSLSKKKQQVIIATKLLIIRIMNVRDISHYYFLLHLPLMQPWSSSSVSFKFLTNIQTSSFSRVSQLPAKYLRHLTGRHRHLCVTLQKSPTLPPRLHHSQKSKLTSVNFRRDNDAGCRPASWVALLTI